MGNLDITLVVIAAIVIAINQALKEAKLLSAHLPHFFTSSRWNYVPAILVAMAAIVYILRPATNHETATPQPTQVPSTIEAKDNSPPPNNINDNVANFVPTAEARKLPVLSNDDLIAEVRVVVTQIADLRRSIGSKDSELEYNTKLSAEDRVAKRGVLARELDKQFRMRFAEVILLMKDELQKRAKRVGIALHFPEDITIDEAQLSSYQIIRIEYRLEEWADTLKRGKS
jgi:hypothetical protein